MPFADLLTLELVGAAAAGFVAAVISGFAGFGLNLVMTPILVVLFSPVEAIPVITVMGLVNSARVLGGTWRLVDRKEVLVLGSVCIFTVPIGAWVLVSADAEIMKRAIAAFVIIFTLIMLTGWQYRGPRNVATHVGIGMIGGFLNSSVGIGGPPVVLYQLARGGDPSIGRANLAGFFAILATVTLVTFAIDGVLDGVALRRSGLIIPFVLLGTWIGMRSFNPASVHLYRRLTLGFLLCVSVMIVVIG
ncbi:MAG: sulfite exporter TauE/SafE family protein [Alphaproteobacteria bacterium]|nr:sulfite exporter TauE/SafE family protein [Rhodospirillaceae bacterium]MBT7613495.1 sulfite exporter TauE/SafE family protein [Rhodospirillaceae bacterium]MDG2482570.1 sulfite exporter TauE/SafE family protein [Alphaproteobacteria bacterium]